MILKLVGAFDVLTASVADTGSHSPMKRALVSSLVLLCGLTVHSQSRAQLQPPTVFVAPAIPGVVAGGTPIQLVKGDFQRTEGPGGMPDGSLLFTATDSIIRIDAGGNVSTFVERANASNGLGFDPRGRLISVQRATGNEKVGVLHPPGGKSLLADSFEGRPFSRLNDLVVSARGAIYFTDENGIYYLPPDGGQVTRVEQDIRNPNGVLLSPDERVLYANDKDGEYLLAFDVASDGTLANRRPFAKYESITVPEHQDPSLAEDNGADGLAIDSDGRLYVATNLGVEVFGPQGQHLGVLPVVWGGESFNLRKPPNVAFGGPGRQTLYMVGAGAVFKVRLLAQGLSTRAK